MAPLLWISEGTSVGLQGGAACTSPEANVHQQPAFWRLQRKNVKTDALQRAHNEASEHAACILYLSDCVARHASMHGYPEADA